MTTPTREQVMAWVAQADAYASSQTSDFQEHGEIAAERLCALAMSAGRDQGLREAAEAVRSKTHHPDDPNNCVWTAAYDHVAAEHVAAIEQLRGK